MRHVPSYTALRRGMDGCVVAGTARLTAPYDDFIDVLRGFLLAIPVDESWYEAQYPAISEFLARTPTETASSHFRKHGYFEGRKPFAPDWCGQIEPAPFGELQSLFQVTPTRGRLRIDIVRDDLIQFIKKLLTSVPVDEAWYRATYPKVAKAIDDGILPSAAEHYVASGYFDGLVPFDISIDTDWYITRYGPVRTELAQGAA
jgi:hypothetical protein